MDAAIANWLDAIAQEKLDKEDVERSLRYAKDLEQGLAKIRTFAQGVSIFGSARLSEKGKWCKKAEELGYKLAQNGHAVVTGGGPSIMQAANKGAYEAGGRSIGLNIELAHEQHINPYVTDSVEFHYFFARKVMLTMASKVYVFFPGGFGTMDEFSEILILMQEGKCQCFSSANLSGSHSIASLPTKCNVVSKPSIQTIAKFTKSLTTSMKSLLPPTKSATQAFTIISTTTKSVASKILQKISSQTGWIFFHFTTTPSGPK